MFDSLTLRGRTFAPARVGAPMAGITHSAFRRLVADFGGHGALFTEMLSARALLNETFANSPYVRRRPQEGPVFYQILVSDTDRLEAIMARLGSYEPAGVDVNLACAAPKVRWSRAGAALFDDAARLEDILAAVRRGFSGPLTVKIRLGHDRPGWQETFADRAALFRNAGVDGVILHPRFTGQKYRGAARHGLTAWAAATLQLPVIVSGDLTGPDEVATRRDDLAGAAGIMIGRMLAVRPWLFAAWSGANPAVDHAEVWRRFADYLAEDFAPDRRLARLKMFTEYFARNFLYGHTLFARVQSARSEDEARARAEAFFETRPALDPTPSVRGIN
jgi:tRNA-dihydrouridine synthase